MELVLTSLGQLDSQDKPDNLLNFNPITLKLGAGYNYTPTSASANLSGAVVYTHSMELEYLFQTISPIGQ